MRDSRRTAVGWIGTAALVFGLLLGGCGATPTTPRGQGVLAPTAVATETPYPTATTDPATVESAGCPQVGWGPVQPSYGTVDGLKVSIPQRYTALDYPASLLPSGTPSAPYRLSLTTTEANQVGAFHPNPPVNPSLATGYALQVCNQTTAVHTLTSLAVTIASFAPSSGPVAIWHLCEGGPYDAATRQTTGGCGGALGNIDWLAATLPADSTGATAPAIAQARYNGPNLPIALGPNASIVLLVAVNGLTRQGTYMLGFPISIDGAAPTTLTPSDGAFLIAPAATVWTGTACQTPAMLAHIAATSQDTYYVCPPGS